MRRRLRRQLSIEGESWPPRSPNFDSVSELVPAISQTMSQDKPKTPVLPSEPSPRMIAEEPDPRKTADKKPEKDSGKPRDNSEQDRDV